MLLEDSYTSLSLGATCCTLTAEQEIIVGCFLFLKQEVEHTYLLQSSSAPRMAVPPPGTYFPLPQSPNNSFQTKSVRAKEVHHTGS